MHMQVRCRTGRCGAWHNEGPVAIQPGACGHRAGRGSNAGRATPRGHPAIRLPGCQPPCDHGQPAAPRRTRPQVRAAFARSSHRRMPVRKMDGKFHSSRHKVPKQVPARGINQLFCSVLRTQGDDLHVAHDRIIHQDPTSRQVPIDGEERRQAPENRRRTTSGGTSWPPRATRSCTRAIAISGDGSDRKTTCDR